MLGANAANAQALVAAVARRAAPRGERVPAGCDQALDTAVITAREAWPAATAARLADALRRGSSDDARNEDIAALIRTIPDFPKPGILFRDITTLLLDARGLARRSRGWRR